MLIRDLDWLVTLAERGHVTETAAALGVSQPTLSRALARIEEELGTRLFAHRVAEPPAATPWSRRARTPGAPSA